MAPNGSIIGVESNTDIREEMDYLKDVRGGQHTPQLLAPILSGPEYVWIVDHDPYRSAFLLLDPQREHAFYECLKTVYARHLYNCSYNERGFAMQVDIKIRDSLRPPGGTFGVGSVTIRRNQQCLVWLNEVHNTLIRAREYNFVLSGMVPDIRLMDPYKVNAAMDAAGRGKTNLSNVYAARFGVSGKRWPEMDVWLKQIDLQVEAIHAEFRIMGHRF